MMVNQDDTADSVRTISSKIFSLESDMSKNNRDISKFRDELKGVYSSADLAGEGVKSLAIKATLLECELRKLSESLLGQERKLDKISDRWEFTNLPDVLKELKSGIARMEES